MEPRRDNNPSPGIKTLFMFQEKLYVSTIVSVLEDKILLENGLWFKGGLSTRHKNCVLVDGSPETIERVEREQSIAFSVQDLIFFFSDQKWHKKIPPELIIKIDSMIKEELLNAGSRHI